MKTAFQTLFGVKPMSAPIAVSTTQVPTQTGATHRPANLRDLVGQDQTRNYLMWKAKAYRTTNEVGDHVLILGPSGCGKTTMAQAYANELGTTMHKVLCPQVRSWEPLARTLKAAKHGDVVFLDEIQELPKKIQQMLYEFLEDGRVTSFAKNGATQVSQYAQIVIVAATTHEGKLLPALLNRFGYKPRLQPYTLVQLEHLVESQAKRMWDWELPKPVGEGIGMLSQGVPRNAMNLLRAMRELAVATSKVLPTDQAQVYALLRKVIVFQNLCPLLGLPMSYRRALLVLANSDGAPMGLPTLASKVNEEEVTVRDSIEPFLLSQISFTWNGEDHIGPFVERTARGRVVTPNGLLYLEACAQFQKSGYLPSEVLE